MRSARARSNTTSKKSIAEDEDEDGLFFFNKLISRTAKSEAHILVKPSTSSSSDSKPVRKIKRKNKKSQVIFGSFIL